ncbi:hypothetical protein [Bdellovibrio sp. BCCA]|uniref:hypothetical protein n=1 Tax=Bdellovibrio sp. BCCA TaxID=3136281 RepID=UPI0030EFAB8D
MTNNSFTLQRLYFPRIEGIYIKDPGKDAEYNQAFRIALVVESDNKIKLLFGMSISSHLKEGDSPLAGCVIEIMADIDLSNPLVNPLTDLNQVPLLPNMLALLYPFIREKVNYYFSNNHMLLLLPPVNTYEIIKDLVSTGGPALEILDKRSAK